MSRRLVDLLDAGLNRLYGWRYNPIYQSGALAVGLMLALLASGLYLLLFYRIGSPYASVARLTADPWLGRWIRSFHRYASDAAVVAVGVHALRMFAQGRSWGPRTLAWVSGLVLLGIVYICGWTGYVMVWDTFGQTLAVQGARLLDLVPIFSEPISRAFVGERPIPGAFFFLNLFLHVALPIGLGIVLWLHVSRVARPTLLPPRKVLWACVGLLLAVSVLWPMTMAEAATLFHIPAGVPADLLYAFWLPLARGVPAGAVWLAGGAVAVGLLLTPLWSRPGATRRPAPSVVNPRLCTGCEQCALDCPYAAITLSHRTDGRAGLVARVDPALCVSCGICAGSCAPMGVGPETRTGRDQLARVAGFTASVDPAERQIVVIACTRALGRRPLPIEPGVTVYPADCAGNVHTSVVEYLIRSGTGGVLIVACPPRDCWNREGPRWLEQRLFHEREAELKERVDRRRVRLVHAGPGEGIGLQRALAVFRGELSALEPPAAEAEISLDELCEAERLAER